ncbi:MAG: cell division protein FtsQ/DivIB [Patescibacteria group bacterium]
MSYRRKHIKNKIHKITPKKSILRRPIFWIFVLFLILFIAAVYFYLFYSGFQIKNIIISGNVKVQSEDIENLVSYSINKKLIGLGGWNAMSKSIFLTNPPELQSLILKTFPMIETVLVEKNFPQNISLQINERKPIAVFCPSTSSGQASDQCFFIDKNGVVFEEIQNTSQDMPILSQMIDDKKAFVGENAIGKDVMNVILKIEKNLKDNFQINIKEAFLSNPFRLDVKTSENWQVYFNLSSDTDLQITKLNSLLKDEISQKERTSLQYIDLRYKDRAYYK